MITRGVGILASKLRWEGMQEGGNAATFSAIYKLQDMALICTKALMHLSFSVILEGGKERRHFPGSLPFGMHKCIIHLGTLRLRWENDETIFLESPRNVGKQHARRL